MKNWSILLPYFNESQYLPATIESICRQNYDQFTLILINNASTDDSENVARDILSFYPHIDVLFLNEKKPGKTNALKTGLKAVKTPFVATCDADTYYPPDYLSFCNEIMKNNPHYVGIMACDIYHPYYSYKSLYRRWKIFIKSKLFQGQCHAGGYAQAFRTDSLRQVKGFDPSIWPYVMVDHEIVHRLLKIGKIYYSTNHWCLPSPRRTDRSKIRWSKLEKFLYQFLPYRCKDWFFYTFLRKRMEKRNASILQLREHNWNKSTH